MPLQNRVMPTGEIVATPHRGTMMGIRGGCFHYDNQTLKQRHWASKRWICCVLAFKGRQRELMRPGLYTELFFLDEATGLAAGHRPCFECRRVDAVRFQGLWAQTISRGVLPRAGDMDEVLHLERLTAAERRRVVVLGDLPDGAFVHWEGASHLVLGGQLRAWSFAGYGPARRPAAGQTLRLLTPPSMLALLTAGYRPMLHPSVDARDGSTA